MPHGGEIDFISGPPLVSPPLLLLKLTRSWTEPLHWVPGCHYIPQPHTFNNPTSTTGFDIFNRPYYRRREKVDISFPVLLVQHYIVLHLRFIILLSATLLVPDKYKLLFHTALFYSSGYKPPATATSADNMIDIVHWNVEEKKPFGLA